MVGITLGNCCRRWTGSSVEGEGETEGRGAVIGVVGAGVAIEGGGIGSTAVGSAGGVSGSGVSCKGGAEGDVDEELMAWRMFCRSCGVMLGSYVWRIGCAIR